MSEQTNWPTMLPAKKQEDFIAVFYFFNHLLKMSENLFSHYITHLFFNMDRIRNEAWQHSNQKLREITGNINNWLLLRRSRREEVVVDQLRLAHCWFSHHHIMDGSSPQIPIICQFCSQEPLTVKHISPLTSRGTSSLFDLL